MKTAVVISTFHPSLCGIATYASEQVHALEKEGVKVIPKNPTEQDIRSNRVGFSSPLGIRAFLQDIADTSFNSLYLHYADRFFFPWPEHSVGFRAGNRILRIYQTFGLALIGLIAGKRGELIIHEISTDPQMPTFVRLVRGMALSCFGKITFHSDAFRLAVLRLYPFIRQQKTQIIPHDRFIIKNYEGTTQQARVELGLPQNLNAIFLCIGFWNPSKGFEDAIKAFLKSEPTSISLYVVGSPLDTPSWKSYSKKLMSLPGDSTKVQTLAMILNDMSFDRWIQAADVVVLPYLAISSSGVAARASLYGKKLILRDLPAFREEYPEALFFRTEEQLSRIFMQMDS